MYVSQFSERRNMRMSRKYVFPDPNDRSKNEPCDILSGTKVLGLYNQEHEDDEKMQKVTQKVQDYIIEQAKKNGWDEVKFVGNQCILENCFKQ